MKKISILLCSFLFCLTVNAQYNPTKKDIGKDCTTEQGKLGTWKEVTVTETYSNKSGNSSNNSSTHNVGVSGQASGTYKVVELSVGGNYGYSNSNGSTQSKSTENTTTRTYNDIQCVEDKNAKLPQQSPVRW